MWEIVSGNENIVYVSSGKDVKCFDVHLVQSSFPFLIVLKRLMLDCLCSCWSCFITIFLSCFSLNSFSIMLMQKGSFSFH